MLETLEKRMAAAALRVLRQRPGAYKVFRRLYRRWTPHPTLPMLIERALRTTPGTVFVQVGANDGIREDPIHDLLREHGTWRGIFVEPVAELFTQLCRNYGSDSRFVFENVAISAEPGRRRFFTLPARERLPADLALPTWCDQIGSFQREHIMELLGPAVSSFILEQDVECITLRELLRRNRIERLDLLHIDTEGYDYQVLRQVDFDTHAPRVILYEHRHLSAGEKQQAEQLLAGHGYRLTPVGGDTLATRAP